MVSKIVTGTGIRGALSYNENKVKEGKAQLISAVLYHKDSKFLSFHEKLWRLQHQADLHETIEHKCMHVSLNFDPSESLSDEQFEEIAKTYMEKIGFGEQPYLIYRHFDAAHPHLHIVTTTIKDDGNPIKLHNNWKISEVARKEIENDFNLIRAESKTQKNVYLLKPFDLEKAEYGKSETKLAISNIVRSVVKHYKFGSIAEFNAALRQFNVVADRGDEGTEMRKKGGLVYSIIDVNGNKIGKPIKASSIYDKPTLKNLESKFVVKVNERNKFKGRICRVIDEVVNRGGGKNEFISCLREQGIYVVFRENSEKLIYGITYVDNKTHCVFNGSDLGKAYSAKGIIGQLSEDVENQEYQHNKFLVDTLLNTTDFSKGIKDVLKAWALRGMIVKTKRGIDGNLYYWMGNINTKSTNYMLADKRMTAYFQANRIAESQTNYIEENLKQFFKKEFAPFGKSEGVVPGNSEVFMNIIDIAFTPTENYDPISYELLREAKKKKRRRNRR